MNKLPLAVALFSVACEAEHVAFNDASLGESPDDIAPTATGAPCGVNEQGEPVGGCNGGQRCVAAAEGFPNGYCAHDCRAAPCPEGTVCFPASATNHFCLRRCAIDTDCRFAEGYVCRAWGPGALPGCLPTDQPIGRRDGGACFSDDDAGVAPPLAPLPNAAFPAGDGLSVTRGQARTEAEAEASLAVDPTTGGVTMAFMGIEGRGYWRGGLARVPADGASAALLPLDDYDFPDVLQPAVAYDRAGRLHVAFAATNPDIPGNALRHTAGAPDALPRARSVLPPVSCALACEAPALAVGPDVGGADVVYVATVAGQRDGSHALLVARAAADGEEFGAPFVIAARDDSAQPRRDPAIAALAAGPEAGLVQAAWVAVNAASPLSPLGDRLNRVRLRASRDGGRAWGDVEPVSRDVDAPVAHVPWVARAAGATHVAYVTGGLHGRWDVVLATRRDGDAWRHRVVNDEPESCATHGFAGLAADPATGEAHLVWLDARFGVGAVAYARCPADPSRRCGRNERVSSAPFALTTSRDPTRWHGTRAALALGPGGALWAAWSDARTGGPGVYLARGAAAP